MSTVTSVVERMSGRGGDETTSTQGFTRVFQVEIDAISATVESDILANASIPAIGAAHPAYSAVKCIRRRIKLVDDDDFLTWEVECEYALPTPGRNNISSNPINDPPRISFGSAQYTRVVERAYQSGDTIDDPSEAVLNSAGQPFDPPVVQEEENMVISITRNERTIDPADLVTYRNTINSASITIAGVVIAEHRGRMRSIMASKAWDTSGTAYWQVSYEIEIATATHIREILDAGYYERNSSGLVPILDKGDNPEPITEPAPLDGSGGEGDPTSPVYLSYQTYWAKAWSGLSLPSSE